MYNGTKFIGLAIDDGDALDVSLIHNLIIEPLKAKVEQNNGKISIEMRK